MATIPLWQAEVAGCAPLRAPVGGSKPPPELRVQTGGRLVTLRDRVRVVVATALLEDLERPAVDHVVLRRLEIRAAEVLPDQYPGDRVPAPVEAGMVLDGGGRSSWPLAGRA